MNTTNDMHHEPSIENGRRHALTPTSISGQAPGYFLGTSVQALGAKLRSGELTAESLVHSALSSIDRLNPLLNAFVHVDAGAALAQAREADAALQAALRTGQDLGPLHGIPVAIKDNIDTAHLLTTYGSAHFAHNVPEKDAQCVANLRHAGAIVLGKTLTHEFAFGPTGDRSLQGAAKNPWNTACMTGGSSAGSAAAVASGMVPLAVGTDTGGSIRIPSGLCGVVGFKPSLDVVSTNGVFPLSTSLDHVGPIAANVSDCALLFDALRGEPPTHTRVNAPLDPAKIAWIAPHTFGPIDRRLYAMVYAHAASWFGTAPRVAEDFVSSAATFQSVFAALQRAEAYDIHAERMAVSPEKFEEEVRERLQMSADTRGWEYVRAMRAQAELDHLTTRFFEHYDVIAMPTLPIVAPHIDARTVTIDDEAGAEDVAVRAAVLSLTSPWNVAGLPALTIPAGTLDGLPVGLQLIAAEGRDDALLALASRLGC